MKRTISLLAVLIFCMAGADAENILFDFETKKEYSTVVGCQHHDLDIEISTDVGVTGKKSLRVTSPKWQEGKNTWPAFELPSPVADWTPFDRICIHIINPSETPFSFGLYVLSEGKTVQQIHSVSLAPPRGGFRQQVIPLSSFKNINFKKIDRLHFYLVRPPEDVDFFIDGISLLKKGESAPSPTAMMPYLISLAKQTCRKMYKEISEAFWQYRDSKTASATLIGDLKKIEATLKPTSSLEDLDRFKTALLPIKDRLNWCRSFFDFEKKCRNAGVRSGRFFLVGKAGATDRVPPRTAFSLEPATRLQLELARNEKESLQLAVVPKPGKNLKNVTCSISDLVSAGGRHFPSTRIDCDVMGYVETTTKPPYETPVSMTWWPDPILPLRGGVDVPNETVQTFWIRARAAKNQAAGLYKGKITVRAKGGDTYIIPISVRVYNFAVPETSPLPLAITSRPGHSPVPSTIQKQTSLLKDPSYPINLWKKKKLDWVDFLADYYISYDSLSHGGDIDFDILTHLNKQGRLGLFNLCNWKEFEDNENARAEWKKKTLAKMVENMNRAGRFGILDHAYIYGCDETPPDRFKLVREAVDLIKQNCPKILLLTTAHDNTYGQFSQLEPIDAFCSTTSMFDPDLAKRAREKGKQVWWHITRSIKNPYANAFIEYDPIEIRLLMGAMTAKMRPDGFLYYQISIWNSEQAINLRAKPSQTRPVSFTEWDPRGFYMYHGDGSWTRVGTDGVPIPTQRLENFRDGLEDYAYFRELEKRIENAPKTAGKWLSQVTPLLQVPTNIVKSMTVYTRDGTQLQAWRKQLAEAIESAPASAR